MFLIKLSDTEKYWVDSYKEKENWITFKKITKEGKDMSYQLNKSAVQQIIETEINQEEK